MDDRVIRPKKLLQFYFFFVPRKWKAKGRARVQLQLWLFFRGGGVTVRIEKYIYFVLLNNSCVGSVAVIYDEVCAHRGFVNLSDRSSGLRGLQYHWHLHQRWKPADYVEFKPHTEQVFRINPMEAGL